MDWIQTVKKSDDRSSYRCWWISLLKGSSQSMPLNQSFEAHPCTWRIFVSAVFKVTQKTRSFNVSVDVQWCSHFVFKVNSQTYRGVGVFQVAPAPPVLPPVLTVAEPVRTVEDLKTQRQQLIMRNTCSEFRRIKEPRFWVVYLFFYRWKEPRWSLIKDILNTLICSLDDWWRCAQLIICLDKIRFKVSPIMEASAEHWFFYLFFFSLVLMDTSVWWTHFPTCGPLRTEYLQIF